jgi:UDP-4-amino-4,6-dideoxy-N-acetyl-beta-L-altrosamine N-acetyltransferase
MIIRGYGIELTLLAEEDIELVRQKRNSAHVRRHMEYREEITPAMQEKWFRSIDNEHNNYYVITTKGKKVGLINGAEVDWDKHETGNGGIFIWEEEYWNTLIPVSASLLLTDISFIVGLERIYIKVLRDNPRAITFNRMLGYKQLPGQENVYNQRYLLTEDAYREATARLKTQLYKRYGETLTCTVNDPARPFCKKLISVYAALSPEKQNRFRLEIRP